METRLATRRFTERDQERFAQATGDRNPIHLDPLAARRTQAGAPVVHGINALLWALDAYARSRPDRAISAIDATFKHFVYVGAEVELRVVRSSETAVRLAIRCDDLVTTTIDLSFDAFAGERTAERFAAEPALQLGEPRTYGDLADLAGITGHLAPPAGDLGDAYPDAVRRLGAGAVAGIARTSTIVGMICPGLHSIYSGISIVLAGGGDPALHLRVARVDDRFRFVEIDVCGSGIAGRLTAFARHPPVEQPTLEALRSRVAPGAFAGTSALVVGGSRGLGALTARALAAGGGRVIVSYANGRRDAEAIRDEIGAASCSIVQHDVRDDAAGLTSALPWPVESLYYFASPQIHRQKAATFSAELLRDFLGIYVDGFARVCEALAATGPLRALYPSSVAIAERPRGMLEYAMAKAAGELLCDDLRRFVRGLEIVVIRLPRVLTDQTATVIPVESADPVELIVPILHTMNARTVSA